ncbi:phospholipase A2 large subunit [Drosophila ficusphila]|uniref:phospholipase A2 large subunit n=1 Tax=Drosophila ficusphila TaxID=30025 RepID=UPI0007E7A0FD|nr:phospholipase A2 large subunit [Drosophila ficusphila]
MIFRAAFLIALLVPISAAHVAFGMGITVPGTRWCGPGNLAENYDDLGTEREVDICCRAHDNCDERIPPKEEAYGLTNDGIFPIFSCACESAFRSCLSALHNGHSLALGRIYFHTKEVCFGYGHPIVSCREKQADLFETRCLSYRVDQGQPKRWQFYDLALYTHISASVEDSRD